MKYSLMFLIQMYWLIPADMRKKCLFRESCSVYVYEKTKNEGLLKGLQSLNYRFKNCRYGAQLYSDPINGETRMILPDGSIITEKQIAKSILKTT